MVHISQSFNQVNKRLTWQGLRPVIPKATDPKLALLLESCWQQNAVNRPDFVQILQKLDEIAGEVGICDLFTISWNPKFSYSCLMAWWVYVTYWQHGIDLTHPHKEKEKGGFFTFGKVHWWNSGIISKVAHCFSAATFSIDFSERYCVFRGLLLYSVVADWQIT